MEIIRYVTFCSIITVLLSCGKANNLSEEDKRLELDKLKKEKTISELIKKYQIKYLWDTLEYDYSIQYENVINGNYHIIDNPDILDIYKRDSVYYISILADGWLCDFYFDLKAGSFENVGTSQIIQDYKDALFVVEIKSVKKIKLELSSDYVLDDYDFMYSYVMLEESDDFIGTGEIIEIVTLN